MPFILDKILEKADQVQHAPGFLQTLFGAHLQAGSLNKPLVIFGAGMLGQEMFNTLASHGISPICFCDNNANRAGSLFCGLPIISYAELKGSHKDSLILIASHKYLQDISLQLSKDFLSEHILCPATREDTPFLFMYAMVGTQCLFANYQKQCKDLGIREHLSLNRQKIQKAWELLSDDHSKGLFTAKLSLIASHGHFQLFRPFMVHYSQPILNFGTGHCEGTPEDYFYFNNDLVALNQNEAYVDVGAYDGDTVFSFLEACKKQGVNYESIKAFEPDPGCFQKLQANTQHIKNLTCHQKGIWSHSGVLSFQSSDDAIHDQAGAIVENGNLTIEVTSLDDHLNGERASLIKMDPGGNVIPQGIRGAEKTISRYKPTLAVGAYHGIESMYEIPLLVHDIEPEYALYLRHNTYHLCDTDMFAIHQPIQ